MTQKALDENGNSICTVTTVQRDGESEKAYYIRACKEVTRQLNRPGRRGYYRSWQKGGFRIR